MTRSTRSNTPEICQGKEGVTMRVQNNKLTAFGKLVVKALTDQDMSKADLAAQI